MAGITSCPLRHHVDPRAMRFSAAATAVVLVIALLTVEVARPLALGLLATQVAVFGLTAFVSVHWSVWAQLFARTIWPRLRPATALEDARPVRFAQLLGFALTLAATLCFAFDADLAGYVLTAVAIVGAVIRAASGLCLGCRLYSAVLARKRVRA